MTLDVRFVVPGPVVPWQRAASVGTKRAGTVHLPFLLKRVALLHFPEAQVAPLAGKDWLRFLDAHGSTQDFSTGAGQVLADGEYRPVFDADGDALCQLAIHWIQRQYLRPRNASRSAAAGSAGVTA